MLLYKESITLNSCRMRTSLKLGGGIALYSRLDRDKDSIRMNYLIYFYAGLTDESRSYLDSCAGFVFRERTSDDAEELMGKIAKNPDDWSVPEPHPPPKKRC